MPRKKARARYGDYCESVDGVLYAVVNVPIGEGKYRKKRKRVDNKDEARQWALGEINRAKHGTPGEKDFEMFADLAAWYKKYFLNAPIYENGLKVEGVKDWEKSRAKLDRMSVFFGPKRLIRFGETDLRSYASTRRTKDGVSTATINRDFALMRAMFKKGHAENGSLKVPKFPINTAAEVERDRVMTFAEEAAVLAVCETVEPLEYERKGRRVTTTKHKANRSHLKAIILLAVDTAMRSGEIFSLKWENVDLEARTITIISQNSKTQKERKVGITPRVHDELSAIKGKDSDLVFNIKSARKSFATACKRAKVSDLHFHDLRHTATTRMVRAGIPHTEVMKITGHTQIKTFLRYLNLGDATVKQTADILSDYLNSQ